MKTMAHGTAHRMNAEIDVIHPCTLLGAALAVLSSAGNAQDGHRGDWLRDPTMSLYKACAEFKMARYAQARVIWEILAEVGNGDALFYLAILAEDGLGEPCNPAKAEALYVRAAQAGHYKAQHRLAELLEPRAAA